MIQTVNINVAALPALRGPGSFMVLSQNENGRQLRFRILGSDLPTGCTATFSGTKPDGNVYSTTGTVSGNFVIVQEDIQMTAVAGIWDAKLEIAKGTENIVTSIIRVTVVRDPVAGDAIPSDSQLDGIVTEVKYYAEHARSEAYGSPLTASTKSAMTDHTRVYVYTGSESGMTAGNWYYWNGSAWTSGGVYNSVAVQSDSELNDFSTNPVQNKVIKAALDQIEGAIPEIDTTLRVAGKAADAEAVGDEIADLKEDLNDNKDYVSLHGTVEFGTADISNGSIVYYNSASAVRTKSDTVLSLSEGDQLIPVGDVKFRLCKNDSGTWTRLVNARTDSYTIEADGDYFIIIEHTDSSVPSSVGALLAEFCIVKGNSVLRSFDKQITQSVTNLSTSVDSEIKKIYDASQMITEFDDVPTVNATYYSNAVRNWENVTTRVINSKTLVFPVDATIKASGDYSFAIHDLHQAYTFTANTNAAGTQLNTGWVTSFTVPRNTNFLLVLAKGSSHNATITAAEFHTALSIELYPYDLTKLTDRVRELSPADYSYKVEGERVNTSRQGYNATRLSFNPPAGGGAIQGIACHNGIIVQGYGDGSIKLIELTTGTVINTLSLDGGHMGSLSFSDDYYDSNDEFPLLYVSNFDSQIETYVYRISRTEFTLLRTYAVPTAEAGYQGFTCINKADNTLWVMGNVTNAYTIGDGFILSHWDIENATEQNGVYVPVLIEKHELPWHQYSQFMQCLNNQLFVGFGARDSSQPASLTDTVMWVIECGSMCVKSVITDFPYHIRDSEIEGCDFIPNGNKYDMLTSQRATEGYWRLTFQ